MGRLSMTQANPTELRNASRNINIAADKFLQHSNKTFETGEILCAAWKGRVSDQFKEVLDYDRPKYNEIYKCIVAFSNALADAAAEYDAWTAEQIRKIRSKGG